MATDYLDGYFARRRNEVTRLGILLDPLADKLLTAAAFLSLVEMNLVPAWVVMIILARELAVTGLRNVAASRGILIRASSMGKAKVVLSVRRHQSVPALAALSAATAAGARGARRGRGAHDRVGRRLLPALLPRGPAPRRGEVSGQPGIEDADAHGGARVGEPSPRRLARNPGGSGGAEPLPVQRKPAVSSTSRADLEEQQAGAVTRVEDQEPGLVGPATGPEQQG